MDPYFHLTSGALGSDFDICELYRYPGPELDDRNRGVDPFNVCVVGAGMAGLAAAYELRRLGHSVRVFEAGDRVGGRIETCTFPDAFGSGRQLYGELGAMRIPAHHRCTLHFVSEAGLSHKLRPFIQTCPDAYFFTGAGPSVLRRDWSSVYPASFAHIPFPRARLTSPYQDPSDVVGAVMEATWRDLGDGDRWSMYTQTPSVALQHTAQLTVWQMMMGLAEQLTSGVPAQPHLSNQIWELCGRLGQELWDEWVSASEIFADSISYGSGNKWRIEDGMSQLPERLAAKLEPESVSLGHRVVRIQKVERGGARGGIAAHVTWVSADGCSTSAEFDRVICATPAAGVTGIEFVPPLDGEQKHALGALPYQSAAKSLVPCRSRPWEADGIIGGASVTDLPIQAVWYPSDSALHAIVNEPCPPTGYLPDSDQRYEQMRSREVPVMEEVATPRPDEPGVLTIYRWGINAKRFASLQPQQQDEQVKSCLGKLHPKISPGVFGQPVHRCWDLQANPGGGAWCSFGPGHLVRYQTHLCQDHPQRRPVVFFAGEHLAVGHAWIQGAIQTGLGAVFGLLGGVVNHGGI